MFDCSIHLCLVTECGRSERESLHASLCQGVCACVCLQKSGSCLTIRDEQWVCVCVYRCRSCTVIISRDVFQIRVVSGLSFFFSVVCVCVHMYVCLHLSVWELESHITDKWKGKKITQCTSTFSVLLVTASHINLLLFFFLIH